MADAPPGVELSMDELRAVAAFAARSAAALLPAFEAESPSDQRPRAALAAARDFADGAPRTRRQRVTAVEAHRAGVEAPTEIAALAARACGDAAAAAYLHPIARATQVGHILRAAACAVRSAEVATGADPASVIRTICRDADPVVVAVLRRYPPAPPGTSRLAQLTRDLDAALRRTVTPGPAGPQ